MQKTPAIIVKWSLIRREDPPFFPGENEPRNQTAKFDPLIYKKKSIPQNFPQKFYNTAAKSNRFGTQDKPNKNVIRTWATTQEKSIQRISRPK